MKKEDLIKVRFKEWDCILEFGKYGNGRTAISLIGAPGTEDQYEPIATATVNLPYVECDEDEVLIKNYSENEGMEEALIEAEIIGPRLGTRATGFVEVTKHKLLIETA